jgi:hypothetical protein
MDQSKKTMRHFYCRDVLWETFEQMANDFDCSIDYLVNEAMRYYARSKNYQAPGGPTQGNPTQGSGPNGPNGPAAPAYANPPGTSAKGAGGNGLRGHQTQPPPPQPSGPTPGRRPQPMTPGYPASAPGGNANPRTGMPTGQSSGGVGAQPHPPSVPTGNSPVPMSAMGGAGPTLFLIYNGQRYPVTKDQFIIGRGSKTSDLPIKDGNISRKHAAVIRRNGTFYIKDLGSTNGIDYKGMRIDNKRIDEGDVFHLCDYELRFTYRAD